VGRMAFPYLEVFGLLLVIYMAYSVWERLDPRYPIGAGLVLLVATAVTDALGASSSADVLAEYVFLLLGAGVVLLLLEPVGGRRSVAGASLPERTADPGQHAADPPEQRDLTTKEPFDHLEEEPVPLVHAAGDHDDQQEQPSDAERQDG
jgi:hypothetical protein